MTEQEPGPPKALLDRIIYYLGAAGMFILFGTVLYGVGMRYIFNNPPLWSADVPNLIFIWLVFTIVGLTTALGPQIRVVFFIARMPSRVRAGLEIASHVAILVMLGTFMYYSIPIIDLTSGQTMLSTGWPGSVYFYALPVGCMVMGYYQIRALVLMFR